ncbi:MAG: hypothetical protein JJU46_01330 [Balneolaceae bacterium]|nr:hypothetical protein [Balneolaceae bacterium]MCH8550119.1 hypothetical protein [Balneolaceae bacterium]
MEKEVVNYLHHLNSPVSEHLCKKRIAAARLKNSPEVFTSLLLLQRRADKFGDQNGLNAGKLNSENAKISEK